MATYRAAVARTLRVRKLHSRLINTDIDPR